MSAELRAYDPEISAEGDARLSEAHHRIANNLALVGGFIRLQASALVRRGKPVQPHEIAIAMEETGARIDTIARLHRLLSRYPGEAMVDVAAYLKETCHALSDSMTLGVETAIAFHCDCDETCEAPPDVAGPLALIVTELVTNAIKYSHPAGVPGRVDVRCRSAADGAILLVVEDDGVGLPEDFDATGDGGLGMRVVRSLAQQLHGKLSFCSDGLGLTVRLVIPAPAGGAESFGK